MTPIIREPGPHILAGDEADVLAWLRDARAFGIAAEVTIAQARQHPGWIAYTPDGCCWVSARPDGTWQAGDSADAEMRLADNRRAPVLTRIDPDQVEPGDTVTYRNLSVPPELLTGRVDLAGHYGYVHVTRAGSGWAIDWRRVVGHNWSAA